jgi:thymidylate synthase (FAD)
MPAKQLHVELVRCTPQAQELAAFAARLCYTKADISSLRNRIDTSDQTGFLENVTESGHLSVLEHASFSFAVEGVSRVLLSQLTRHRIASFSVQSQRYVSLSDAFSYIVPPRIAALGDTAALEYDRQMRQMHAWYAAWQQQLGAGEGANEDARFVLPGACETRILITMNARELLHFFSLRCCNRAQWEIRAMAEEMLKLCMREAPAIFKHAGPGCVAGSCPEGSRTCGQSAAVRIRYQGYSKERE